MTFLREIINLIKTDKDLQCSEIGKRGYTARNASSQIIIWKKTGMLKTIIYFVWFSILLSIEEQKRMARNNRFKRIYVYKKFMGYLQSHQGHWKFWWKTSTNMVVAQITKKNNNKSKVNTIWSVHKAKI